MKGTKKPKKAAGPAGTLAKVEDERAKLRAERETWRLERRAFEAWQESVEAGAKKLADACEASPDVLGATLANARELIRRNWPDACGASVFLTFPVPDAAEWERQTRSCHFSIPLGDPPPPPDPTPAGLQERRTRFLGWVRSVDSVINRAIGVLSDDPSRVGLTADEAKGLSHELELASEHFCFFNPGGMHPGNDQLPPQPW